MFVQYNTVLRSRKHCWHKNATMRYFCIVDVHTAAKNALRWFYVAVNNKTYVIIQMSRNFCQMWTKFGFPRQIFIEVSNTKINENLPHGRRAHIGGRTDGRTDEHDECKALFASMKEHLKVTELNLFRLSGALLLSYTPMFSSYVLSPKRRLLMDRKHSTHFHLLLLYFLVTRSRHELWLHDAF
jgi:hypothetical protein